MDRSTTIVRRGLPAAVIALILVASACSSDDDPAAHAATEHADFLVLQGGDRGRWTDVCELTGERAVAVSKGT